ncbi:hypothetical protein AX16_000725 [Volvariella volvacea WC 439]|nr:hypothetical protein AX16_000725 [Volvariella volvacea WC 439]
MLATNIKPFFIFPGITVMYRLDFLPFEIPGFVPNRSSRSPILISEPINIITQPAPGVVSKSLVPPSLRQQEVMKGNYEKTVGVWKSEGDWMIAVSSAEHELLG